VHFFLPLPLWLVGDIRRSAPTIADRRRHSPISADNRRSSPTLKLLEMVASVDSSDFGPIKIEGVKISPYFTLFIKLRFFSLAWARM
jgi:hypothetical protein